MTDFLVGGGAWWVVPISLLDDQRRQELFGEFYAPEMGRMSRFEWVFQQLETALREGLAHRRAARHAARRRAREELTARLQRFAESASAEETRAFMASSRASWSGTKPFARPRVVYRLYAFGSARRVVPRWWTEEVADVLARFERRVSRPEVHDPQAMALRLLGTAVCATSMPPPPPPPLPPQRAPRRWS